MFTLTGTYSIELNNEQGLQLWEFNQSLFFLIHYYFGNAEGPAAVAKVCAIPNLKSSFEMLSTARKVADGILQQRSKTNRIPGIQTHRRFLRPLLSSLISLFVIAYTDSIDKKKWPLCWSIIKIPLVPAWGKIKVRPWVREEGTEKRIYVSVCTVCGHAFLVLYFG